MVTLRMAQQLKTKDINVVPGQVVSVKLNFYQRQVHCVDDQDKFQSVPDTDKEFTQSQRKKLQTIGISPVTLYVFMKTLKSNISEAYKEEIDCLKDSQSDSYDKNGMKEKVNDLFRLVSGSYLPFALSGTQDQI